MSDPRLATANSIIAAHVSAIAQIHGVLHEVADRASMPLDTMKKVLAAIDLIEGTPCNQVDGEEYEQACKALVEQTR